MSRVRLAALLIATALLAGCGLTNDHDARPVIISLSASPDSIGPADSTRVTCRAFDLDDDLVYDWFTDARLTISGNPFDQNFLYNTSGNSLVFYPGPGSPHTVDTAWVECSARDGRGKSASRIVNVIVLH